ncbi:SRPBCC family protein [Bdellovibrio sp. 22V]|uniref:SRPBCC family protein n=1 Tax=Bdellovibrio sp. 22V TaxID=3044166 RepID=UPI002542EC82|nr:SRPBCC family protein [Bdellovibrio sp. 22V]WII72595.1 SRPBCC family protein [Bdellovibrio sp. 22V]
MDTKLKILITIPIVILVLLFIGLLLPARWSVERSVYIQAPPTTIYPLVANFKEGWTQWSAFDYEDPAIKYAYSGPLEGKGASRSWVSAKMGNGSQTITKADPLSGVEFELLMEGNSFRMKGEIIFTPSGEGTQVKWRDSGDVGANPVYRYLALFMDKFMGETFEKSLDSLKRKAEEKQEPGPAED